MQGLHAGGGTLEDPYLRIHASNGVLLSENDDISLGVNRDSQVTFTANATGTFYIEAGSFVDSYTGTYTVSVQSANDLNFLVGTPGPDFLNGGYPATRP